MRPVRTGFAGGVNGFGFVPSIRINVASRTLAVSASVRSSSFGFGFLPMLAPFEAPRLKIARAQRHIEELASRVADFWREKPISIVVEDHPSFAPFNVVWTARISKPVPHDLAPIVGDAIHNLRTALDLMASDLVQLNRQSTKGVYFPIAAAEAGLDDMIKDKNFRRAGPDAVALLKNLKPFRGGNEAIRALHDLDLKDKHQALLPIAHGANVDLSYLLANSETAKADDIAKLRKWSSRIERDGQMLVIPMRSHSPPVGTKIKAEFALTLDHEGALGRFEIVAALNELARIVEAVVGEFEGLKS